MAESHPNGHISKVAVKVGELAGVDRDALQFGFECLVKDTNGSRSRWKWNPFHACNAAQSVHMSFA